MTFDPRQLSFIITSIVIRPHPRHRHRHRRYHHHHRHRHHHHHYHHCHLTIIIIIFSCVFSSCLPPPAFIRAKLSSSVLYLCAGAVSFCEAKLVLQTLRSVIRIIFQTLQHFVVHYSWNLAWAPVLGNIAWHLFIRALLGNLFLGTLYGNLFLRNLLRNLSSNKPVHWDLVRELFFVTLLGNLV